MQFIHVTGYFVADKCEKSWFHDGASFCYFHDPASYEDAADHCEGVGYDLLTIRDDEEMEAFKKGKPFEDRYECLEDLYVHLKIVLFDHFVPLEMINWHDFIEM